MQMNLQSRYRKKIGTASRKQPDAQGDHKTKQRVKEKDASFLQQMTPGHHLNSSGNMLKSLGAKQDSTILPSFWDMRGNQEQQIVTQKLSCPSIFGNQFQQKYSQLFWGLPSLHSESLVAAAWVPHGSSTLPSPFFFFNAISNVNPVPRQDEMSPVISQAHHLSYLELRSSALILSSSQFQHPTLHQAQSHQAHLHSSFPAQLSASLTYNRNTGTPSQPGSKTQGLPTQIQWSFKEHVGSGLGLPWMAQSPPDVCDVSAPNNVAVPVLAENFPISPDLREKLEEHIQKWLIQHQWNHSPYTKESLERRQLQKKLTGPCFARNTQCPSQSLVSKSENSSDVHKVKFQLEKESGKNLGPILGMTSKDVSAGLVKTPMRGQGVGICGSEQNQEKCLRRELINQEKCLKRESINQGKCLKRESISDSTKHKNIENALKTHLGTKSKQIIKGLIPLSVRRSWLALISSDPTSDSEMEARKTTSSKSVEKSTSSSQKLNFLSPHTQETLEAHLVRFWVRHKWALPLKALKPINLIKSLPVAGCSRPSSTSYLSLSDSAVDVVRFPGKPSQTCLREVILTESSSSLGSLLLLTSPSSKEMETALLGIPSDTDHKPSKAPTRTPSQRRTAMETQQESREVPPLPRTSDQEPKSTSSRARVFSEFPHRVEKESGGQPQVDGTILLLPDCSKNKLHTTDTVASQIADDTMVSRTTDTSASQVVGDIMAPSTTDTVALQIADDTMVSRTTDTSASQVVGDIMVRHGNSSLRQQKVTVPKQQISLKGQGKTVALTYQGEDAEGPSTPKNQNLQKDQSKMLTPAYQDEDRRRRSKEEERPEVIQVKEKEDNLKDTSHQPLPKMTQVPLEGPFQKISRFLKWIRPKKAIKGEEKPMKKGNPATPKTRKGGKKKPRVDSNVAEAQQLMAAVGQMLEKKMMLQQKLSAPNVNKQRESPLVHVSSVPYGHGPVPYSEQRRASGYIGNPYQRNSVLDKQVREEQPLKNIRFNNERQAPQNHNLLLSQRPMNLVNPFPAGIVPMARVSSQHLYCPRHSLLHSNVASSAVEHSSLLFSSRKTYLKNI